MFNGYHKYNIGRSFDSLSHRKALSNDTINSARGRYLTDSRLVTLGTDFLWAAYTRAGREVVRHIGDRTIEAARLDDLKQGLTQAQEYLLGGEFPETPTNLWNRAGIVPGATQVEINTFYQNMLRRVG